MIDYSFKSEVLSSFDFQLFKKYNKVVYKYVYTDSFISSDEYLLASGFLVTLAKTRPKFYKECVRLCNSHFKRVKRLKDILSLMLASGPCIFLTLTFDNRSLECLSAKTRREYVTDFLSQFGSRYVANIDFGKKNEREHYHAVIQCNEVDYSLWKCGAINGERVRISGDSSSSRLSRYIAKLTNHAIKETTRRNAIIYGRPKQRA